MNYTNEELLLIEEIMQEKKDLDLNAIDELIHKTKTMVCHRFLFRGVCNTEHRKLEKMLVGDVFEMERPTSFTPDISIAYNFAAYSYHTNIIIKIKPTRPCMNYYEHAVDYVANLPEDKVFHNLDGDKCLKFDILRLLADERECIYNSGCKMVLEDIEEMPDAFYGEDIKVYYFSLI